MFEIYDTVSGAVLLGGFTTVSAAARAAHWIFPDRLWKVRKTEA